MSGWANGADGWRCGPLRVWRRDAAWHWFIDGVAGGRIAAPDLATAQRLATKAAHEALDRMRAALPPKE